MQFNFIPLLCLHDSIFLSMSVNEYLEHLKQNLQASSHSVCFVSLTEEKTFIEQLSLKGLFRWKFNLWECVGVNMVKRISRGGGVNTENCAGDTHTQA